MMIAMSKQLVLLLSVATMATFSDAFGTPENNRRQFFQKVATKGALIAGTAAAVATGAPAFAATATKYYTPAEHSLDGKLMVVTGGTAGLGLETVKRLATGGASVVLTSRTAAKGSAAVAEVKDYLKSNGIANDNICSTVLDLDDLESVKGFPERLTATVGSQKTNVLINNAGVMAIPERELTKDGYERTFQSNHLGHFVLTAKMMDKLAPDARVINVSSEAYLIAGKGMTFDNLLGEKDYGPWSSYGQSKLANILFTKELQQRADQSGRSIKTYSLHPGAVQTDLARNMMGPEKWDTMKREGLKGWDAVLLGTMAKFIKTVEDGASTQIFLAASDNLPQDGGEFFVEMKDTKLQPYANDMDAAAKLWTLSEKLGNIEFKL